MNSEADRLLRGKSHCAEVILYSGQLYFFVASWNIGWELVSCVGSQSVAPVVEPRRTAVRYRPDWNLLGQNIVEMSYYLIYCCGAYEEEAPEAQRLGNGTQGAGRSHFLLHVPRAHEVGCRHLGPHKSSLRIVGKLHQIARAPARTP